MKYVIEHTFEGLTLPEFEALYFDEPFNVALGESLKLGRTLVKLERTPEKIVRQVRCEPVREPGTVGAKIFGDKRAGWVDYLEYDVGKFRGHFRSVPSMLADKVTSSGVLEFVPAPNGVKRVVVGEVNVDIFGIGRRVEKAIVAGAEKGYAAATDFTMKWAEKPR